jgi:hypothetical protein
MLSLDQDVIEKLSDRLDGIKEFLKENREILASNKYLDEGTPERVYWHAGYASALSDIINLVSGTRKPN